MKPECEKIMDKKEFTSKVPEVKLPSNHNAVLVQFNDDLTGVKISLTPNLWEMFKLYPEEEFNFTMSDSKWQFVANFSMKKIEI